MVSIDGGFHKNAEAFDRRVVNEAINFRAYDSQLLVNK